MELNLPADGEQEKADTAREGGVFSQNSFTLKHVLSDIIYIVNGMIMMACSVFDSHTDVFVKHQEAELSEGEVNRISNGSKIRTQVKVRFYSSCPNVKIKMSTFCFFNVMFWRGVFCPQWSRLGVLHCAHPLERFPAVSQSSSVSLPLFHKTLEPRWRSLSHSSTPEGGDASGLTDLQEELLRLMGKDKTNIKLSCYYHSLSFFTRGCVLNHTP